ncbi:hypothetical protein lerEdw1_009616 [Lerista edwardsae]|nr:hypothetical protein lerEdw1_009616 [Lerista edwardsae]
MTQYINCRPGFSSEAGEAPSLIADRQEGLSISEPWGSQSGISERWGAQAPGHWLSQAAASESQGTDEFSYAQAESQDAFGEIQVIPVQVKEEESEDEISPELDVASPIVMETQAVPRHLISMLDQRPHLRTRKQKAQADRQSGYQRGTGPRYGRSHQPELQRMQRQAASQAEERKSLAEFIQHDREMRREDREFQAQLFEKLFQKQVELVQVLTQSPPPSPPSPACTNPLHALQVPARNGPGAAPGLGPQLQALLEQIVQAESPGKGLARLAVKETLPGAVKVPPDVQYWTAEEILRWLLSQQCAGEQGQEIPAVSRPPPAVGQAGAPGKGSSPEAQLDAVTVAKGGAGLAQPALKVGVAFLSFQTRVTSEDQAVDSAREDRDEEPRQPRSKDRPEKPRRAGLLGTEAHLRLRKRTKSALRDRAASRQDGERGDAAAKLRKRDNSVEGPEATETGEKAKPVLIPALGKQAGESKRQGRSLPGCDASAAGERPAEGTAKAKGTDGVSEALNGMLPSRASCRQKTSAGLGPSRLAFGKGGPVSCPQLRNDGPTSSEGDGPSLSDSIDTLLDSPWSGNGSGDAAQDGSAGSRVPSPCADCAVLKAELDTVREELRITQASTLYGLSGPSLQGLSEALGTVVDILRDRRPAANTAQNVAAVPSRPLWRERKHF